MQKSLIIGLIAVVIIGGVGYLALHKKTGTTPATNSTTNTASTSNSSGGSQNAAATITYSDSGFSPGSTTVKSGESVAIKNTSSNDLQLDSNPHPAHTDDGDLNVGIVGPGQTKTFTVTKKGTFGFHNHPNPDDSGTITVQ